MIFAVYREHKSVPSEAVIQQVARSVLLSCEEVKFWFDHLHQTHENRKLHKPEGKKPKVSQIEEKAQESKTGKPTKESKGRPQVT